MITGFCLSEQADVPITPGGRCIADQTLVIAPSTGCCHQRLIASAWSLCTAIRRCKPVEAGTWRKPLSQQVHVPHPRSGMPRRCNACRRSFRPPADDLERRQCSLCFRCEPAEVAS